MVDEQRPAKKRTRAPKAVPAPPAAATESPVRKKARRKAATAAERETTETVTTTAAPPAEPVGKVDDHEPRPQGGRRGVPVPFTGVHIPVPHVPLPSQHDVMVGAVRASNAVRENAPSREQVIYYGGLGALAAFGVVDWPVAAAIGVGVWIARRRGADDEHEAARTETSSPAPTTREPAPIS